MSLLQIRLENEAMRRYYLGVLQQGLLQDWVLTLVYDGMDSHRA